tara:strand:+ start:2530 stop:2877 length:348 start_codon:yes stop_codon:yes gene_type:complete
MNKDINEDGYYTGAEVQWNVEDVEEFGLNNHPELELSEEDCERILVATFQDNEHLMQMINESIGSTIDHMLETGALETPPPMCSHCGDVEVEAEGQPCSKECRDGYVYDWLTENN